MAKFRTNHARDRKGSSSTMIARVGIFAAILGGLFVVFDRFTGNGETTVSREPAGEILDERGETDFFLPTRSSGQIIRRKYYTLSYSEAHEQAEWVAYLLTREQLQQPWVDREDAFRPDPEVRTGSATPEDYRGSGYDRGHLLPVADRSFNREAMLETFYMSNISPQAGNFNGGIWRELEELTRNWAKKFEKLYVITGPVLSREPKGYIGENEVAIPAAYFKVLLDIAEPGFKGIGFIIPNQVTYDPLYEFAVSIDEVEEMTGFDFFPDLMPLEMEEELESSFNLDLWQFSKQKYDERVNKWNKR